MNWKHAGKVGFFITLIYLIILIYNYYQLSYTELSIYTIVFNFILLEIFCVLVPLYKYSFNKN